MRLLQLCTLAHATQKRKKERKKVNDESSKRWNTSVCWNLRVICFLHFVVCSTFPMWPLTWLWCQISAVILTFHVCTGRFIMFFVITNIYNKKTKRPTLMELFTATGNWKSFFFATRDVRCVHREWHGTDRYDIQVLARHASTWVHRYSSLLQWSVPLSQRSHVATVLCVLCTKCTLHSNHRLTRVIFQHTKRLLPRSGHFLTTYTRIAYRQICELRWKTTYWERIFFLVVPSICTGFVNTCPTVFL